MGNTPEAIEERKEKRKRYQKWYYETYLKKRRDEGTAKKYTYTRKSPEEKAENYKRGAEKRRQTMLERFGEDGVKEIYAANGERLKKTMAEQPEKRYRLTSEKAKEISKLGLTARLENKKRGRRKKNEQ